jgi:hypothetical protein
LTPVAQPHVRKTGLATASADGTARLWDTAAGRCIATFVPLPEVSYAVLLSDGSYKLAGAIRRPGGVDPVDHGFPPPQRALVSRGAFPTCDIMGLGS